MKKVILQKRVLLVLTLVLLFAFVLFAGQAQTLSAETLSDAVLQTEEKVYCDATLDEDFADDSVLVGLKKEVSLNFKSYTAFDFAGIKCSSVSNLTASTGEIVKSQIAAEKEQASVSDINKNPLIVDNSLKLKENAMKIDTDKYRTVLRLDLKEKSKENVLKVIKELEKRNDVYCVEPNYTCYENSSPNDTYLSDQCPVDKLSLKNAWSNAGTNEVKVAVIDSGISGTHLDLVNRIDANLSRDYLDSNGTGLTDPRGHGTVVAGVIAAEANNSRGIAGVCWTAKLVSLRVLDASGEGNFDNFIAAINYASAQRIPIINFSIGGYDKSTLFEEAIIAYPGLFVCGSGNDDKNNDIYGHYPSNLRLPNLIAVGASNEDDSRRSTSNYGATAVDLFAPGTGVYTTTSDGEYDYKSGTSIATPHVAGVAALLLSKYPDMDANALKRVILNNVEKVSSLTGYCVTGGRLSAANIFDLFASGAGVLSSPYLISTAKQLQNVYGSRYYKLTTNITLSNNWMPIAKFSGTFEGNNWQITNMKINLTKTESTAYFGFVGENSGYIQNVTFNGCSITQSFELHTGSYWWYVGFITGSQNSSTISNCRVIYSSMQVKRATSRAGGIAGANHAQIYDCTVTGTTFFSNGDFGGIAGRHTTGWISSPTVQNCTFNSYTIFNSTIKYNNSLGGLVGVMAGSTIAGGSVTGCKFNSVGGRSSDNNLAPRSGYYVGLISGGTVSSCSNSGNTVNVGELHQVFLGKDQRRFFRAAIYGEKTGGTI